MSEIATYRCSDKKCRLTIRLSKDFPVWHQDTPMHLRTLSVAPAMQSYVARYRSESFCHQCRKIGESTATNICTLCQSDNVFEEQADRTCPQCKRGTFLMEELKVR